MKVTLLNHTQGAKDLLIFTKQTRLKMSAGGLKDIVNMSEDEKKEQLDYMVNTIKSSWEFVDFTFLIEGVSRAFTHQFVRNRMGSYAQQTMRILDVSGFDYVTGPSIEKDESLKEYYDATMGILNQRYNYLIEKGASIEDARGILPTNICTNIVAKYNLRTLSDMLQSRQSPRTQCEFREVGEQMFKAVVEAEPWIAPFLRNGKHHALNELQELVEKTTETADELTYYYKLIDQVRNTK